MKIVTWNCQGAFRQKAELVARFAPDVAIIQECECPERLNFPRDIPPPTAIVWFGERLTKGIGILSYTNWRFSLHKDYDPTIKYCVPLHMTGTSRILHVLAVWAMNHQDQKLRYIGQVAQAMKRYGGFIGGRETLMIGDFNSNKRWDQKPRIGNHSWVVTQLAQQGLVSVYHQWSGEAQGEESVNTLYMYRRREHVYHIDYCFVPETWMRQLRFFSVGDYAQWVRWSDHMPLFVEFTP